MITFIKGDILTSKAQVLVNPVNCVGVMGKGLALDFKKMYPNVYKDYKGLCENGKLRPGTPYYCESLFSPSIVLFPTKDHWRSKSNLLDIEKGLKTLRKMLISKEVLSIALPHLGCGLGGLNWAKEVRPLFIKHLSDLPIQIEVYER